MKFTRRRLSYVLSINCNDLSCFLGCIERYLTKIKSSKILSREIKSGCQQEPPLLQCVQWRCAIDALQYFQQPYSSKKRRYISITHHFEFESAKPAHGKRRLHSATTLCSSSKSVYYLKGNSSYLPYRLVCKCKLHVFGPEHTDLQEEVMHRLTLIEEIVTISARSRRIF